MEYPIFYRKAGKCIRVDGPTETWTIGLPPDYKVPVLFPTAYPDEARMLEAMAALEPVDKQVFKDFLITYYSQNVELFERMKRKHLLNEIKNDE